MCQGNIFVGTVAPTSVQQSGYWNLTVEFLTDTPKINSTHVFLSWDDPDYAFVGQMDELAVYNYVLPQCAISNHARRVGNLSRYWDDDLSCVCMFEHVIIGHSYVAFQQRRYPLAQ